VANRRVTIILCDPRDVGEILDGIEYPFGGRPGLRLADIEPPSAKVPLSTAPQRPMDGLVHHDPVGDGVPRCLTGNGGMTDHLGSVTCTTCLGLEASVVPATQSNFGFTPEDTERLRLGRLKFAELVRTWTLNFNVEGAVQPARGDKLMATFSGMGSGNVIKHIKACGGLTTAVMDVLVENHEPDVALSLAKDIALNMVQCGSVMAIPIQRWIEANVYLASSPEERAALRPSTPMMEEMEDETNRPAPIKTQV
jgi:hypothetical protein